MSVSHHSTNREVERKRILLVPLTPDVLCEQLLDPERIEWSVRL